MTKKRFATLVAIGGGLLLPSLGFSISASPTSASRAAITPAPAATLEPHVGEARTFFRAATRDASGNSNELIALVSAKSVMNAVKASPATCVDELSCEQQLLKQLNDTEANSARAALGGPIGARYLIEESRIAPSERAKLEDASALSRLMRYVVLRYATVDAAKRAHKHLQSEPYVMSVTADDGRSGYSAAWTWTTPLNDPWVQASNPFPGQWGMHSMQFPSAWTITPGGAYLGMIETGFPRNASENVAPFYANLACNNGSYTVTSWHCDLADNLRPHLDIAPSAGMTTSDSRRLHGAHIAGILAARGGNGVGVSGGCPWCSVVVGGVGGGNTPLSGAGVSAFYGLVARGVQAINISANAFARTYTDNVAGTWTCGQPNYSNSGLLDYSAWCAALTHASDRGVTVVASAGNFKGIVLNGYASPAFPATESSVLSVGGISVSGALWDQQGLYPDSARQDASSAIAGGNGVVAPARSIMSTFPANQVYNWEAHVKCGDTAAYNSTPASDESGVYGDGYGTCTGTSMAAPHITALVGLVRTLNPLLSNTTVKGYIRSAGHLAPGYNQSQGSGLPNARKAVNTALLSNMTRLTPLFSFYDPSRASYFYTVAPQMGSAALGGSLLPAGGGSGYTPEGTAVNELANFPGYTSGSGVPSAQAWVFTTPSHPAFPGVAMLPVLRLSSTCYTRVPGPGACASVSPNHWGYVYVSDPAEVSNYLAQGFRIDGTEGYVLPISATPLSGMVRLLRRYNTSLDTYALFPETTGIVATMTSRGYTSIVGADALGYVYANTTGSKPAVGNFGTFSSLIVSETAMPWPAITGTTYPLSVTVRNTGSSTWTAADGIKLAFNVPPLGTTWTTSTVALPNSVPPNGTATFNFNVTAPSAQGNYHIQWRMYINDIGFFGAATYDDTILVVPPEE